MGKLIVTEFVTLDGVAQGPGQSDEDREEGFVHGGWQAPLAADDTGDDVNFEQAKHMDALLLGRKTYEIFAAFWPTAPEEYPFTGLLNRVPKYVASHTLAEPLAWKGSKLLDGDLVASVTDLKARNNEVH
ncbi:MAG TPA: dihydrofolate reductase family protein, partial [Acidimicrobiia bacterium]